jgi:site-specific DNA-adenine methylase
MWSYYGSKKSIAKHYPQPIYDTIIEPFSGAAQYSLFGDNWQKRVILVDKYDVVSRVWKYLINASKEDILGLPDISYGEKVDDLKLLAQEEKWLIGFCINTASAMPKRTASKRTDWNRFKLVIADNLYKVKHWEVVNGNYSCLVNMKATWYIDPPYQNGGIYYRMSSKKIDYQSLADWCRTRDGQVIVCENSKADWLDFKPLVKMSGQLHQTTEVLWYKE